MLGVEVFVAGVVETLGQVLVAILGDTVVETLGPVLDAVLDKDDTDDKERRGTLAREDDVSLSVLGDLMTEVGVLRDKWLRRSVNWLICCVGCVPVAGVPILSTRSTRILQDITRLYVIPCNAIPFPGLLWINDVKQNIDISVTYQRIAQQSLLSTHFSSRTGESGGESRHITSAHDSSCVSDAESAVSP